MTIELTSTSEEQTMAVASAIGGRLRGGEVITLDGPLGAGKTCFVRGLARGMGLDPATVSSPTFIICQEYEQQTHEGGSRGSTSRRLAHLDLYRVGGPGELESIGWEELLDDPQTVIAIEWPGRIEPVLAPLERIDVRLEHTGPGSRRITMRAAPRFSEHFNDLQLDSLPEPAETRPAPCPICRRAVPRDAPAYPFCSERCRLVDLGQWFSGSYTVSRELREDDE